MNRKSIVYLILLITSSLLAQVPTNVDSLKNIYFKNPEILENITVVSQAYAPIDADSAYHYAKILLKKCKTNDYDYKARGYNMYGHFYFVKNQLDSSIFYYEKAISLTKLGKLNFIQGVYTSNLAQIYLNKGEIQKCITTYKEAEGLLKENDYENKADYYLSTLYSGIGDAYNYLSLYDQSLNYLFKSYEVSKKYKDYVNMGITLATIATVYRNLFDLDKHEQYNRLAMTHFKNANYPLANGMVYFSLAENAHDRKDYKKSEILLDSAKNIITSLNTDYGMGDIYNLYGLLYMEQNKYDQAESYFKKSLETNLRSNTTINTGNSLMSLGTLYDAKNEEEKALDYYKQALNIFEKENILKEKKNVLEKIIDLDLIIQHKDTLKFYTKLYKTAANDYLNVEKQKAITGQEILYETEIKEAKILSQELQLDKERIKKNKILFIFGFIFFLFTVGIVWLHNKEKRKVLMAKNTLLSMQHDMTFMELQNLNQQLNPHEFKNLLVGFAPEIQEKAPEAYKSMIKLLNLTQSNISNKSLTESVSNQLIQLESYLNLKKNIINVPLSWTIENTLDDSEVQIPRLLLKNLVQNAVKHGIKPKAEGGEVLITLKNDLEYLYVIVDDNGVGRNKENNQVAGIGTSTYIKLFSSLNLNNKRKAIFNIIDKEIGTQVVVKIPLDYQYV